MFWEGLKTNRFIARLFITIILLCILLQPMIYAGPGSTESTTVSTSVDVSAIKAPSVILMDAYGGQVLYEKDSRTSLHISAACKLMTVLLAIESGDLTSNVTISSDSVDAQGSALSLEVGKKYTLEDLLYGIMLTSANDAAKAVAESIGGDTSKFVDSMNAMAAKLGMKDTHFKNPTGLYDEAQYTTAYDISLLIRYAITKPAFKTIFSVKARPWYSADGKSEILTSQNKLFWSYPGVDGGKTGYNEKEKQTVVTTAQKNGMELIGVVLDSPENDMFNGAAILFDHGFNNFMKSTLVHNGEVLKTVEVDGNEINLISQSDVSYVHPLGEDYIKEFSISTDLQPPIKKNKPAGTARYVLKDGAVIDVNIYPQTEIIPPGDFLSKAKKQMLENKDILYLIAFLLLLEAIFFIAYLIRLIKRILRKKKKA